MNQTMDKVRNIVAAVGQFPQDDPVLVRAAEIASLHEAKLTIVHVIESFGGYKLSPTDLKNIQDQIQHNARERVETAVAKQLGDTAGIDVRIERGSPAVRLTELIDEMAPDLVVMRAHQGASILKKIIGSTTDRVIRSCRVPVLVVKRPIARDYQQIVVSIDTSDDSVVFVPFVAALFPSAKLSLIHFVEIPHQFESAMMRAGAGKSVAVHRNALIRKAQDSLRAYSSELENRLTSNVTRVIVGDPATSLVRTTWSKQVDLIAVGSGSTGKIRQALLGSVTRRVLRDAACDVLVCRTAPQDDRT